MDFFQFRRRFGGISQPVKRVGEEQTVFGVTP
jgi:hypothetical protein